MGRPLHLDPGAPERHQLQHRDRLKYGLARYHPLADKLSADTCSTGSTGSSSGGTGSGTGTGTDII